jgi:site-specific DNA-cytosine methylase
LRVKTKPKALDLFCGKGSVAKVLSEKGYEVVTVDINTNFKPTHNVDVLDWKYWRYPPKYFDIISASVPCTEYSRAKTIGKRNFEIADKLVQKTLEIVGYFQPKLWWIENPRTGFLPKRPCIQNIPFINVDYCQFSNWGYQKPTRIWGSENLRNLSDKICDGKSCSNLISGNGVMRRNKEQLGGYGMKFSTYHKWTVPQKTD